MKSAVKKIRKLEKRALNCIHTLLQHIFIELSAQNLMAMIEGCLPFEQIDRLKQLYNSKTLSKEATELEDFHKIYRRRGESVEAFIIRLDQQSLF